MKSTNSDQELFMADLIILNGNVITLDAQFSIVEAVAIKGDKIVATGSTDDIKRLACKKTRILDLKGATMLPGFNDSHCHISDWALSRPPLMLDVRYPVVKSIADIVTMVHEMAVKAKPGEWIKGEGWDEGYLKECLTNPDRKPSREDLDKVAPGNPVILVEYSGHRIWVNSKALEMAGIRKDTPDPVGGRIDKRSSDGEPSGLLYEKASQFIRDIIPPWNYQQRKAAIPNAMAELNSLGITSFTDAGVDREKWATYNDAFNEYFKSGRWSCRVNMLLMLAGFGVSSLEGTREALKYVGCHHNFGNEWLRINGAKVVADGIPPLKTGWMYDAYIGGGTGGLVINGESPEDQEKNLRELISLLHKNRFQVGIHATGERTIEVCTDQYMKCIEEDPWDARHYTIHSDFAGPSTIKKVSEFGMRTGYELGMNVQSSIKWTISDFMSTLVGAEREGYHWPLRTMLDNGIHVADSSDAPVTYPDWKPGIQSAVLRESKATGQVSGPGQRITVQEAIRNYTLHGAWLDHQETVKGSIEMGKLADLCIIDGDILTVDPHKIINLRTLMTIVGGRKVFDGQVI
jgi:predicted amidohydrolase YtcJ